ncbi:MAG: hypothetical protein WBQ08_14830 [Candidatus Sulfotelmatobacter sp.]
MRYDDQSNMTANARFPFFRRVGRALTGRWARRFYAAILLLLLLLTTVAQLRLYLVARKIQAVLHGLAEIRIDQTTEEQLTKMVPYLTQYESTTRGVSSRGFYAQISNEKNWLPLRFMSFNASVQVQDGKVSQVEYGLANQWTPPQFAGYVGYIVSARSVHGFWLPHQRGFEVTSVDDNSPQYRPTVEGNRLNLIYTNDAPPELTKRAFHLELSCFWSLRGCDDASQIALAPWNDAKAIQAAAYQQLISEKCPDSIIEGRMRYLPDISVFLLEVTGSRRIEVNEEGGQTEDWFTDYKLKEVIRGQNYGSWKNVRFGRSIPSPEDPTRRIANQIYPSTKIGTQVLFFGYVGFDACRFIPATQSAMEIVRKTPVPPKRPEDQIPMGLR